MGDLQIVFYIILGIIWLIVRVAGGNKNKKPATRNPNQQAGSGRGTQTNQAPKTFEELLRELGQDTSNRPTPRPTPTPDPLPSRLEQMVEEDNYLEDDYEQPYDQAARDRFMQSRMKVERVDDMEEAEALDRTLNRIREHREVDGRFKEFAIEKKEESYYAKLLRDPQGIKDAIVINTILNRPYDDTI